MNQANPSTELASSGVPQDSLRKTAMFDYILHICCIVFSLGLLSIVPLIINYVRRPAARGTIYESHFTWQIRTCWWTLFWIVALALPFALLTVMTFGLLSFVFALPIVWFLYRMIKGMIWLNDGKPMPV